MESRSEHPRSRHLMSADDTALLVVDVQEKLFPLIRDRQRVAWNIRRLIDAARLLGLPVAATEQYPKGLGATIPELAERLGAVPEKKMFSCRQCSELIDELSQGAERVLVCGIETHVCVAQTVFDLLGDGWDVYLAVDAVGSRAELDHDVALRRMETGGAVLSTTEAVLFEWCETADHPQFKAVSRLVREQPPG